MAGEVVVENGGYDVCEIERFPAREVELEDVRSPRPINFKPRWPVTLSPAEEEEFDNFAGNCHSDPPA